jgi:uncharacterized membrane protein YfcA
VLDSWSPLVIGVVALCVLLYGISKTSLPTLGMLAGPVLAAALGTTYASAFAIPLLIVGDLFALARYRQHVQWRLILRLIPGILVGFALMAVAFRFLSNDVLARILGALILVSVLLELYRRRRTASGEAPDLGHPAVGAAFFGPLAGATTMAANAGGAAMSMYLVAMRTPMLVFMGTSAWFFFVVNVAKIPVVAGLGLMTGETLRASLVFVPAIVLGAVVGLQVFKRLSQKVFDNAAVVLSGIAGLWLLLHG